ncbi:MAG: helix-turn-helix transcriptional regulator [Bacteroidia bacterium]|nr:helix-turn-helix transcriptional regulator [Bacteroidia bacterium]
MKKDILKKFGERVRELRLQNNWSQEELADQTGFHRTYIGMVERGERNLSLKNIEIFAKKFGITLSELLNIK